MQDLDLQLSKLPRNNPTDLLHGILCEHVKHESMKAPFKNPDFDVGSDVKFEYRDLSGDYLQGQIEEKSKIDHDFIYSVFHRQVTKNPKIDYDTNGHPLCQEGEIAVQSLLKGWKVHRIYFDKTSSYFGVLYIHMENKQLVLAHRSTHSDMAFNHELLQPSSVTADLDTILMGKIGLHQAHAYRATASALEIGMAENFALSFTGHSLGAFLAELSVFYCHSDLKFPYVRAVTFDGPGSRNMMEQLAAGTVEGGGHSWDDIKINMDIIRYTAQPNAVNCTNHHIGVQYCLDVKIDNDYDEEIAKAIHSQQHFVSISKLQAVVEACKYLSSHTLTKQLACFDLKTQKPFVCHQVKCWPSLYFKDSALQANRSGFIQSIVHNPIVSLVKDAIKSTFFGQNRTAESTFTEETSTLASVFKVVASALMNEANLSQFIAINQFLQPYRKKIANPAIASDTEFSQVDENQQYGHDQVDSYLAKFNLAYRASYQTVEPTRRVRRVVDYFERCMFQVSIDRVHLEKVIEGLHRSDMHDSAIDECQNKNKNCLTLFKELMSSYSAGKNKEHPNGALFLLNDDDEDIEDVKQQFKRFYWQIQLDHPGKINALVFWFNDTTSTFEQLKTKEQKKKIAGGAGSITKGASFLHDIKEYRQKQQGTLTSHKFRVSHDVTTLSDDVIKIRKALGGKWKCENAMTDEPFYKNEEIEEKQLANYSGFVKNGTEIPHGPGIKVYEDGTIHEGFWKDGRKFGLGRTISPNQNLVIEFRADQTKSTPELGWIIWIDSMTWHEGYLFEGVQEGKGLMGSKDGSIMEGLWFQGMAQSCNPAKRKLKELEGVINEQIKTFFYSKSEYYKQENKEGYLSKVWDKLLGRHKKSQGPPQK